jgi:hypothetical protein
MMDWDEGMLTAANLKDKYFDLRNQIEFDVYKEKNFKNPVMWMKAKAKLMEISDLCFRGKWPYDALVIDSITGMAQAIKLYVMHLSGKGVDGAALAMPMQNNWGLMVAEMEAAMTIICSLPCLVLVTAHETSIEVGSGDTAETMLRVMGITRNHSDKLPWTFDEVWYTRSLRAPKNEIDFIVSGKPSSSVVTRTRSGFTTDIKHNDIGLTGVLAKIGYTYPSVKAVSISTTPVEPVVSISKGINSLLERKDAPQSEVAALLK